jgi:hypothetical protein
MSRRVAVANYPDYAAAQRAVDYLSDRKLPVGGGTIVGTGVDSSPPRARRPR